jgi:3-phosphoshikimate 1-carboxyvinyltransferase
MNTLTVQSAAHLHGRARVPGDKSISHRALMLGALAEGDNHVRNFLPSGDCLATLNCLRALGIEIERHDATTLTVHGRGLHGLCRPDEPLDCVRSGTTMRLLTGILAGQRFDCTLTGAPQLLRRPMRRITQPLRHMGANIDDLDGHAPLMIRAARLCAFDHTLAVASAQVKSALLLAGLYALGPTAVRQCGPARDHTELMLAAMGADIAIEGLDVTLVPPAALRPLSIDVPGDFSSASFLLVAAALVSGSEMTIEGVNVNPTRTGLLDVLREMGAEVVLASQRPQNNESVADVTVSASRLVGGVVVGGDVVVRMIDEFPILAVAATQAEGRTVVRDARELRVKETDRIATVVAELGKMGANIEACDDGFVVRGPTPLQGTVVDSRGDHRLAMALAVAGLVAGGETVVQNADCIADSFPGFGDVLKSLTYM